jgi:hypothetical protein
MSKNATAVSMIESRITAMCKNDTERLRGETDMAIEMAHALGAIDSTERRHFVERRDRIIERSHQMTIERIGEKQ